MYVKAAILIFLVFFSFAMTVSAVANFNAQLAGRSMTSRSFGYKGSLGIEPTGDPVDGPPSPRSPQPLHHEEKFIQVDTR